MRQRYRRKPDHAVTAVRLPLTCGGLTYQKWGSTQHAKPGDWLVDSGTDVYSVDADSFAATYRQLGPGRWLKTAPVWAEPATQPGWMPTLEGQTHYEAGDWLVSNREDGTDTYAVSAAKFLRLYEPDA